MARMTPEDFADKLIRRGSAAVEDYKKGVADVSVAPTVLAVKKLDKMRQRFLDAMDTGKVKRRMEGVSLEDWKNATLTKGSSRIASGLTASKDKIIEFASEFLPFQESIVSKANVMPDTTMEDSINKMVYVVRETAKFQRR
jgi:hypothetical protein